MWWFTLSTVAVLVSLINAENIRLDFEEEIAQCSDDIMCGLKDPELYREMNLSGSPKFTELAIFWMKNISLFDEPYEDTTEFWVNYMKHNCHFPKEKRREIYRHYAAVFNDYMHRECADLLSEECVYINKYRMANVALTLKVIAMGYCNAVKGLMSYFGAQAVSQQAAQLAGDAVNAGKKIFDNVKNIFG